MEIKKLFDDYENEIIENRRWFHQHPEVSLKEKKTSEKIKEELDKMGISYEDLPPNFGVVATIKGSKPGKTLAIRADIDALPVKEETGLPFASENEGVMHACGHDAHAAMLLGAAKVLNAIRDELSGTIKCVFQVAEEIGQGYQEVLDYFESIGGVDGIIGLHIWSAIPEGQILLYPGAVFAGGKGIYITVRGKGGHGARPDLTHDPIKAACDLVLRITSIPSNFYDVLDHSVVNIGKFESGTMGNIIPGEAYLAGGLRWYKPGGGEAIMEQIQRMAEGTGKIHNVECEVTFSGGVIPVMNNPEMINQARRLLPAVEGLREADQTEPICAGDNYGYLINKYPGFYGVLGGGKPDTEIFPQHHCRFDLDERAFRKGAEFMVRYAVDFLG